MNSTITSPVRLALERGASSCLRLQMKSTRFLVISKKTSTHERRKTLPVRDVATGARLWPRSAIWHSRQGGDRRHPGPHFADLASSSAC